MERIPIEIFGHPIDVHSVEANEHRTRKWCPFLDVACKKRARLPGVCTVSYQGNRLALCPHRFHQEKKILRDIGRSAFGSLNNLLLFNEVAFKGIGQCDYVIGRHAPLDNAIEDFVIVEYQAAQTTSTGGMVQAYEDYFAGRDIRGMKGKFNINFLDIWKREFTQVLFKGMVAERWSKHVYWVVQPPVYDYLVTRYKLAGIKRGTEASTVFAVFDLRRSGDGFEIVQRGFHSVTVESLFRALRRNQPVPDLEEFKATLSKRVAADKCLHLSVQVSD
jgi:hypothetical protein